ncbi:nuclear transport factor 2 family protein [Rhodococcus sp. JS3073]|uniref:nuclear transport factor 2 family protein n=1 Tax=Rhodococcus sp. JS3073 TaxID=3002901 RepID=UPI002E1F0C14
MGGVIIHGRSDATMNRLGVRIGGADIYEVVEQIPDIRDALVVGVEQPDGGYWMPLFVDLADGAELTDALVERIRSAIRTRVSPRHVPDEVIEVPALPRTLTGKRLEIPVKRLLQGVPVEQAINPDAVDRPQALAWFAARPPQGSKEQVAMTTVDNSLEELVRTLFIAVDRRDADALADLFADDITFRFGSADCLAGKSDVAVTCATFLGRINGIRHEIEHFWQVEADRIVVIMTVHYERADGRKLSLPCANTFRIVAGRVADYRIFMDVNPVFA